MRRIAYPLLVAASLLLALKAAPAATRPRYGGTLRVQTSTSISSLDPAQTGIPNSMQQELETVIFDRLIELDQQGTPQPRLAVSWEHDPDYRRWLFHLRSGVTLHNGSLLRPHMVVLSLAASNPDRRVRLQGGDIVIESGSPMPNLLAELACARHSVVVHTESGGVVGTGPFSVSTWEAGNRLVLAANDDYWDGRPFLDSVQITMGRPLREQALDLQLGRADVIELSPDQIRNAVQEGQRVSASAPAELVALLFADKPSFKEPASREAISLAIDRTAIQSGLLQKQGEAAGGLLPQWVSGYSFLFPVNGNVERARQMRRDAGSVPQLTLAYDWKDPLARSIAQRIGVNAKDAGLVVQPYGENLSTRGANADARMVRVPLASPDAAAALSALAAVAGHPFSIQGGSSEELFAADRALRADFRLVPIAYVPEAWGLSPRVKNWVTPRDAGWRLADVWLESEKP